MTGGGRPLAALVCAVLVLGASGAAAAGVASDDTPDDTAAGSAAPDDASRPPSPSPSPSPVGPSAPDTPSPAATPSATTTPGDRPGPDATPPPAPPPTSAPVPALADRAPGAPSWPVPPPATARSYLLVDATTSQVLAARAAGVRRPVASTVKMLTALTARRLLPDPAAVVVVAEEVADLEGASTSLQPGDERTVRQLLEATLVRSGNDAAVALAVAAAGSVPAFVAQMAADATALGLDDVVLASPTGLEDRNRLAATDLAVLALALLDDPVLAEVVDLPAVDLPGEGTVPNRNELVLRDPTVTGVKTGFTMRAGNSVVASAERDGRVLVAVVLGAPEPAARFDEAAALFDHAAGFAPAPLAGDTVLACAGPDALVAGSVAEVLVPVATPVGVSVEGAGCDTRGAALAVAVDDVELARLPVPVTRPASDVDDPDAVLGRAVVDAVQSALRAAPPGG